MVVVKVGPLIIGSLGNCKTAKPASSYLFVSPVTKVDITLAGFHRFVLGGAKLARHLVGDLDPFDVAKL